VKVRRIQYREAMKPSTEDKGETVIYQRADGKVEIAVTLHKESLWLSPKKTPALFERGDSSISGHIRKVFSGGEW
jgi:hypothetical protein